MGVNLKEIKKIANFCRKIGISQIKTSDFEISFSPYLPVKKKKLKEEIQNPAPPMPPVNNLDLLLWSSTPEGMDESFQA